LLLQKLHPLRFRLLLHALYLNDGWRNDDRK
jgi:hypothetical protein